MNEENYTQNASMIVCDNLVKIYQVAEHDVVALQGLDLVVQTGELMGIVGVSGSGKTTLLNILGGLDRPSAGRVWSSGQNLLKLTNASLDRYRLSTVGFVWQQSARNLISYMSALKNIEMPMNLVGESGRRKRLRAEELLDMVGLLDRRDHKLSELSGGEQQRVAIAVALVNRPKLLLADEPVGEVDEGNAQMIYRIFKDLNQELNLTTLIVSHDVGLARHVDRVVAIRDGKVATETLRQVKDAQIELTGELDDDGISFTELIVLDSAGRLQIPEDLMEKFGIQRRVQLEVVEEGILIRPVAGQPTNHEDAEALTTELNAGQEMSRWQKLLSRWLPNRGRKP
jgi:ABC-type lipoprotein export system ATPase subunit/bifunctional DNA-binding transcriptional regulator/antitoxin component of YhaV-PrlF toxin-antitoxin module